MSRVPGRGHPLALTLASSATAWAALTYWHGLVTYPSAYLLPAAVLALVLALVGAALDGRVSRAVLGGVLTTIAVAAFLWVARGHLDPLTGGSPVGRLRDAVETVRDYPSPATRAHPSATPLLFLGCAVTLPVVQWLGAHRRRAPLAGLALLAVVAVPSGAGRSLPSFLATATGFLCMLALEAHDQRGLWGRTPPTSRPAAAAAALARAAAPIGAVAMVLAVVAALVLPVPSRGLLSFPGDSGPITLHQPVVDMRQTLERGGQIPLVEVTTDDPHPEYLRIAALNRFTGTEWSSGDRSLSTRHVADGDVPLSQGISPDVPRTSHRWDVRVQSNFDSTWLPTAYPISEIDARGDWRWDPATVDFLAAGDTNAAGEHYAMTAERLDLGTDGRWFQDADAGSYPAEDLVVPATVSTGVRMLAEELTAHARNDYERALILQAYFRDNFRYSLRQAPEGTVGTTMDTFLERRIGYCEQFASTMATMARVVGVPARVAVGFLRAHRVGADTWDFTTNDLHAWPELYFRGTGWIRFEPTPAVRVGQPPSYTTVPVRLPRSHPSDGSPRSRPSQQPTRSTGGPGERPTRAPVPDEHVPSGTSSTPSPHSSPLRTIAWAVSGVAGLVALVVGALLAASGVRGRRRASLLAGDPEDAWAELRATAVDLGLPWPAGRSPREVGSALAPHLGGTERAQRALDDVVGAVEEHRYAAAGAGGLATRTTVGASAEVVITAMTDAAEPRTRRRARWLPRSLLSRS